MTNEKRLIDANALMDYINKDHSYSGLPMAAHILTMELLTYAPAVDAVEVVRCKDCVHYEEVTTIYGEDMVCAAQGVMKVCKTPEDFCSWGERRAE